MSEAEKPSVAFVGVGRMGSNMARRLTDVGYRVTAVYDAHEANASALAAELGAARARSLADVTATADAIVTVVSDDAGMNAIFAESGDSLLANAGWQDVRELCDGLARDPP